MTSYETLTIEGVELDVRFEYEPAQESRFHGHPDTWEPGYSESLTVTGVYIAGVDITILLDDSVFASIENELLAMLHAPEEA